MTIEHKYFSVRFLGYLVDSQMNEIESYCPLLNLLANYG